MIQEKQQFEIIFQQEFERKYKLPYGTPFLSSSLINKFETFGANEESWKVTKETFQPLNKINLFIRKRLKEMEKTNKAKSNPISPIEIIIKDYINGWNKLKADSSSNPSGQVKNDTKQLIKF